MEYFKLLQLDREPFSNSPDPDYFFQSQQHLACLQKLELALRLRRGLNVVTGEVGTGKTTLCRELIRKFAQEPDFETHLILDPSFNQPKDFLVTIFSMLNAEPASPALSEMDLKEKIKQRLFLKGVDQDIKIVLIIDEGQKLSHACIEILRELLNYETNTFKLLQIVIFAQKEFEAVFEDHANFADRINLLHSLEPISFRDTRRMIRHRLKLSSNRPKPLNLFSFPAQWAIHRASRGYPRRIIHLCHQSLLAMIVQNRAQAGWRVIRACKNRIAPCRKVFRQTFQNTMLIALLTALILIFLTPMYLSHIEIEESGLKRYKVPADKLYGEMSQPVAIQSMQNLPISPFEDNVSEPYDKKDTTFASSSLSEAVPAATDQKTNIAPIVKHQLTTTETRTSEHRIINPSADPKSTDSKSPKTIGRIFVQPGDTLGDIIRSVYGSYRPEYVPAVVEANLHIKNPNNILLGDSIILPALRFDISPEMPECFWINLDEYDNLETALQKAESLQNMTSITLRVFASWTPTDGMRYQLMIKGYFSKQENARAYLASFPEKLSDNAQIISGWPEKALLFSDPYSGGVLSP